MGETDLSSSRSLLMPVVLLALCAAAGAQFPFGGDMGGGGGSNPFAEAMKRVVMGTLEDINPVRGYLQVSSYGRDSRIVVVTDETEVWAIALVPATEIKVGDRLDVTGIPTAISITHAQIGAPLGVNELMEYFTAEEEAKAEEDAGDEGADGVTPAEGEERPDGMGAMMGMMGGGQAPEPPTTSVSGTVKSLDPLVLSLPGGLDIAMTLPQNASVSRRERSTLEALDFDVLLLAMGRPDQDGYLVADRLYIGETLSLGRMGGRRGGGGMMFMGGGPPGGMGGGPRGGGRGAGPQEEGPGE